MAVVRGEVMQVEEMYARLTRLGWRVQDLQALQSKFLFQFQNSLCDLLVME